jgi:hypothetical protein
MDQVVLVAAQEMLVAQEIQDNQEMLALQVAVAAVAAVAAVVHRHIMILISFFGASLLFGVSGKLVELEDQVEIQELVVVDQEVRLPVPLIIHYEDSQEMLEIQVQQDLQETQAPVELGLIQVVQVEQVNQEMLALMVMLEAQEDQETQAQEPMQVPQGNQDLLVLMVLEAI